MCVGGGGCILRGEQKKVDLIKGGIKFGRNMVRGKRITNSSRGNTFFDNLNV